MAQTRKNANKKNQLKLNPEAAGVEEVILAGKVCLPPCQVACPVGEDIQRTNVMISRLPLDKKLAKELIIDTGNEIYEKNPLFMLCAYFCGLCEKECNYKDKTGAIRRKMLKRFLVDEYMPYLDTKPAFPEPTKDKVAVIGGGPTGLMAAYELGRRGYRVTIFERGNKLGGAMRWIPAYRLPASVRDAAIRNLLRIGRIKVVYGAKAGEPGHTVSDLEKQGFRAIFVATGTPLPRPLTFGREMVPGFDLQGVIYGLNLLADFDTGKLRPDLFKGQRVIVIGGGNVAFDAARVSRRLGGSVTVVCLENADKSSRDGIPADIDEIEGATEEGIKIVYSRGVFDVIGENGRLKRIRCPKVTSVYDETGFNPKFDMNDIIVIDGEILLVTIGQGPERAFFQQEGLLNAQGRMDVDPVTLMSNLRKGVFVGGDVRRVGFAAEAMRDGKTVAESIDRYISGRDMKAGRVKDYEKAATPRRRKFKEQPGLVWLAAGERLNFEPYEKGFTIEEAVAEAKRCLDCGPCKSCKGCILMGLQPEIPEIEVNDELCSGCGVCVSVCPYDALKIKKEGDRLGVEVDATRCKRCGLCVSACPSNALSIKDTLKEILVKEFAGLSG